MNSLLDRARAIHSKVGKGKGSTPEKVELALAWLRGEIGINAAARALKLKGVNDAYIPIATALKQAHRDGIISINKVGV